MILRSPALACLSLLASLPASAEKTGDPFPAAIEKGSAVLDLRVFATIPGNAPARISLLSYAPNGQLFANDQRGPLYALNSRGSVMLFLDLTASEYHLDLLSGGERGFQSFAFHPDYNTAGAPGFGKFYTLSSTSNTAPTPTFTPGGGGNAMDEVLLEWTTSAPGKETFVPANPAAPFRELIRWERPFGNHTVGLVAFNPNSEKGSADYGKLYIGSGDGGSGGDPLNLAQNPQSAYGKILRIDPLGKNSANGQYGIPGDNPFVGDTAKLAENWAIGFRNPQRFTWDRVPGGPMYIADIGQNTVEEIDLGIAGGNYGWKTKEGSYTFVPGGGVDTENPREPGKGFIYPIAEYDHAEGNAITGGFVLHQPNNKALDGRYIFGDIAKGRVFYIDPVAARSGDGGQSRISEMRLRFNGVEKSYLEIIQETNPGAGRADLRFGMGPEGELYLLNKQDGRIYAQP